MKCQICKHRETSHGMATVPLTRGETAIVIRDVPADIYQNCGEYYLTESIAKRVYALADAAAGRHAEVEIIRFAA